MPGTVMGFLSVLLEIKKSKFHVIFNLGFLIFDYLVVLNLNPHAVGIPNSKKKFEVSRDYDE